MYNLSTVISGLPVAELSVSPRIAATKKAVMIYAHRGICRFSDCEIWVNTALGPLVIKGKALRLSKIDNVQVSIVGNIYSIGFQECYK